MAKQNRHSLTDQLDNEIVFSAADDKDTYPYGTRINQKGEVEYRIPMESDLADDEALSEEERKLTHCGEISFFDGNRHTFRFYWSTNRELAFDQRTYLNTKHSADRRFVNRNRFFEGDSDGDDGEPISRDENPILATTAHSYSEVLVNDIKERMVAYVLGRFPKQPLYGRILEMFMIQKMTRKEIADELEISYDMVGKFLRPAQKAAGEYYEQFVPKGQY